MRTHGLKGEWRVRLMDGVESPLTTLWIRSKLKWLSYDIEAMRPCGSRQSAHQFVEWNEWLLKVHGIDSIDDAKVWVGEEIAVAANLISPLEEGEYYVEDLVGCVVSSHTDEGIREMGEVVEVFSTGSNEVLRVSVPGRADQLIPFIDQVISKVDLDRRVIEMTPLPGLLSE
ncbi:MAG: 16S rRNA processing protein RimM [Deltaproteobacteria bacterium]|nr:16S rRNA processing protein RimM [Deltaproteobacteria bacterium]